MALLPRIRTDDDSAAARVNPLRDFWEYMRTDRPHRWPALGLAITIPLLVMYFIIRGSNGAAEPQRSIIYVQSWRADRSEFDVRRDWLARAMDANDRNERRRNVYGRLAGSIGQDFDKAKADAEFAEARAQIAKAQADLERAERLGLALPPLPVRAPAAPPPTTPAAPPP